jgi:Schlafen group 3, DNA/RNA helicase domain
MAYGWIGTGCEIAEVRTEYVERVLRESHATYYAGSPGDAQVGAWRDELGWLSASFRSVPETCDWGVVLEYELPGEGGRRPDVVVLTSNRLIVLEFKRGRMRPGHIDQVKAYAADLADYHSESHDLPVDPVLVYPDRPGVLTEEDGVRVIGADRLPETLRDLDGFDSVRDVQRWVRGTYAPLPSLVGAAKRIFRDEPLPAIKRAESAGIPELLNSLHALAADAERSEERHLVLISGVPGSGKTLVGLQFVYEHGAAQARTAVLYSGNDPLVQVLQHVLGSAVFVRRWHDFDLQVGPRGLLPDHNVLVFDEAQRAWDRDRMLERKGINRSEPELVVDVASRLPRWSLVVGLIGEGQEIYLGEESGLGQWADAVRGAPTHLVVHGLRRSVRRPAEPDSHPPNASRRGLGPVGEVGSRGQPRSRERTRSCPRRTRVRTLRRDRPAPGEAICPGPL